MIAVSDQHLIRKIFLPQIHRGDDHIWSFAQNGIYTVKSGYWIARQHDEDAESPLPPLADHPDQLLPIFGNSTLFQS